MFRSLVFISLLFIGITVLAEPADSGADPNHARNMKAGLALFAKTVRPALEEHCLRCHGGDKTRGGLNLATRAGLLEGGDSGIAVKLEAPKESYLLVLMRHEEEPFMPAKKPQLSTQLIRAFEEWIRLGAPYDKPLVEGAEAGVKPLTVTAEDRAFWSFERLVETQVPAIEDPWIGNEIDRFVLARQRERGVTPNTRAQRRTLARRAFLDLLGLPPSPEELNRFLNDTSDHAWSRLVDRLLDSPHYGERQARYWMDVARFAESFGFEQNYDRPNAYPFRDFLIEAFNQDMPWDRMVRWQLAGDELAPDNPLAWMATGFLVGGVFPTQITEAEFEQARYDELDDMVTTTGAAFMGLSIGCARCHDHKYDPIPVSDYYQFAATFATAIRCETPVEPVRQDLFDAAHRDWKVEFDRITARLSETEDESERKKIQKERKTHEAAEPKDGKLLAMICSEGLPPMKNHADGRGYPHFYPEVHQLKRGDPKQKAGVAEQSFLQVLMPSKDASSRWQRSQAPSAKQSHRRAGLASWVTDSESGAGALVARVIVNRIWQQHFGTGIVATPNDFGFQGARPTHPALLDWLAKDLIDHGWELKRLHKQIMLSATYQQSAGFDEEDVAVDPENELIWRFEPRRLEAEPIRDSLLAVSGLLDRRQFGPGSKNETMERRSIYFTIKRSELPNVMLVFDWPEHLVSIGKRSSTTVAPQALYLMNDPEVRRYAAALADRSAGSIDAVYSIALGRLPTESERKAVAKFLQRQAARYPASDANVPMIDFCQTILASNEFLYLP